MSKKRLFLGSVGVVPRDDLKRHLEYPIGGLTDDEPLRLHLDDILRLPPVPEGPDLEANDHALDVFVTKFQGGFDGGLDAGHIGLPLFWRPSVQVTCRLRWLRKAKTVAVIKATKRMTFYDYFSVIHSPAVVFGLRPGIKREHIVRLLDEAIIEVLEKVRARL